MSEPRYAIVDFDGTVCLGEAPVYSYAAHVGDLIGGNARASITAKLDAYFSGTDVPSSDTGTGRYLDGYSVVGDFATAQLSAEQKSWCYLASREELARGELEVYAPAGLADFLRSLPQVWLVTNAPLRGVQETLETLGLAEHFDRIITNANKPAGLTELLNRSVATTPALTPHNIISIGDIWHNDLAPAAELGCTTALIDRFDIATGDASVQPTFRGTTFEQLYPDITHWMNNSESRTA